ncbi:MAG: nucleotidyltransferase family protein [Chloroflexi bacterium]|nr:nucleotidyltransferase family protein [Chloroflexota bacterium]
MPRTDATVSGVILAAGASSRMGRPKQLLPLGGKPLLQHVIDEALASSLDEVIVVLGHRAEEIQRALRLPERVRVVVNPEYERGQSTSLRLGLRSAGPRTAAAAVLLGDQPGVTGALIDRLIEAFRAADAGFVRPVYTNRDGKRLPGHPVLIGRKAWPEVEQLTGDQGARALMSKHPEWLLEVPLEGQAPADLDTPEEYERAADVMSSKARARTGAT